MNGVLRRIRLLPVVVAVGVPLLGLKGEGLVRVAWAQEQSAPAEALVLAKDTAPVATDATSDETPSDSAAEVDVLSSLAKRRAALDAREADLNMRAQVIAAAENRVDGKIATLKQLQDQINALLTERDAAEKQQIASLVKTYSAMRPKDAARIFNNLSDDVLIPVARSIKPADLAPILAAMNPDAAQKLTIKLADRLKLPDVAPPAPVATAALASSAATAPQAAATQQNSVAAPTAAATNP
jgi:flagellar motility protein MotE (MotC chaperone)